MGLVAQKIAALIVCKAYRASRPQLILCQILTANKHFPPIAVTAKWICKVLKCVTWMYKTTRN